MSTTITLMVDELKENPLQPLQTLPIGIFNYKGVEIAGGLDPNGRFFTFRMTPMVTPKLFVVGVSDLLAALMALALAPPAADDAAGDPLEQEPAKPSGLILLGGG